MKIEALMKKLEAEFNFSEFYESLDPSDTFNPGCILLSPSYGEKQRPWMSKAYKEWMRGERTIVLIAPIKTSCKYFKKYLTDVAEVRPIKEPLYYNNLKVTDPMIIAVYWRRIVGEPNFTVSFN